ncbi:MAG: DUF4249 domain-containing protein [Saprospiraceae bacterium]|nr:DUF4249 domain-containing protein [Saprospiraceae bacterium]
MKFKNIFLAIAIVSLLSSCTEKIELKLDDTYTRIVVDGEITSEVKAHQVILSKSTSYFNNEAPPPVIGAKVTISDGTNTYDLSETEPGIYKTQPNVQGVAGRIYTLTISDIDINGDGKDDIFTASSEMKPTWAIDSITQEIFDPTETPLRYLINGWGQEDPMPGQYYLWRYYKNNVLETDTLDELIFVDDEMVNGSYIAGLAMFLVDAKINDTIKVESRSITKDYYEFINSFMAETVWNAGSFGGPPANVKTNVSNGGLGYFNAIEVAYVSTIIK